MSFMDISPRSSNPNPGESPCGWRWVGSGELSRADWRFASASADGWSDGAAHSVADGQCGSQRCCYEEEVLAAPSRGPRGLAPHRFYDTGPACRLSRSCGWRHVVPGWVWRLPEQHLRGRAARSPREPDLLLAHAAARHGRGTATYLISDRSALQGYIRGRINAKPAKRNTTVIDGKLVDADTGELIHDYGNGQKKRNTTVIDGKLVDADTGELIHDYGTGSKKEALINTGDMAAYTIPTRKPGSLRRIRRMSHSRAAPSKPSRLIGWSDGPPDPGAGGRYRCGKANH